MTCGLGKRESHWGYFLQLLAVFCRQLVNLGSKQKGSRCWEKRKKVVFHSLTSNECNTFFFFPQKRNLCFLLPLNVQQSTKTNNGWKECVKCDAALTRRRTAGRGEWPVGGQGSVLFVLQDPTSVFFQEFFRPFPLATDSFMAPVKLGASCCIDTETSKGNFEQSLKVVLNPQVQGRWN